MERKSKKIRKIKTGLSLAIFFILIQISFAHSVSAASIEVQDVINLTNKSRIEAGLDALVVNEKLMQAAIAKANDMFANQYFDHNSPQGLTPWDFIKSAGYEYQYAGENLAIDFITAGGAHKALMESSSHRENILNLKYSEIGIAVVEGLFEQGRSIIIVEEFGAPFFKKQPSNISLQELDIKLEEKIKEIDNNEIASENIQKVKSETILNQEIIIKLEKLPRNQNFIGDSAECLDHEKLEFIEIKATGVCQMERKNDFTAFFLREKNIGFAFQVENKQKINNTKKEYKLGEKENPFLLKKASAEDNNFHSKLAVEVERGLDENELLVKLTFFNTIIIFMLMSGTALFMSFF
ncbi:CAP domain-containing protein [Patescibacteria group bacterium]|nr:CAP domain-containing protein [Patescibacteria group bacterium]